MPRLARYPDRSAASAKPNSGCSWSRYVEVGTVLPRPVLLAAVELAAVELAAAELTAVESCPATSDTAQQPQRQAIQRQPVTGLDDRRTARWRMRVGGVDFAQPLLPELR